MAVFFEEPGMSSYRKYMEVLYIKGINAICTKYSGSKNIEW
jgi:hypothetical protein